MPDRIVKMNLILLGRFDYRFGKCQRERAQMIY